MDVKLEPTTAAIRHGRRQVAQLARDHGASRGAMFTVELLTSELVTNAVKYGAPQGSIEVEASVDGPTITVAVSDGSALLPRIQDPQPHEPGGRGVRLVAAMADSWGARRGTDGGKSVWFTLDLCSGRGTATSSATRRARSGRLPRTA